MLKSMGGKAEGLACADPVARTPIRLSGICLNTMKDYVHFIDKFI
jgi:hypothetical protein